MLGSLTLLASAAGGLLFGLVADRFGSYARAHGQRAAVFDLHRPVRPGAEPVAARAVSHPARHRHGRRMGQRRRARFGDVARRSIAAKRSGSCRAHGPSVMRSPPRSPRSCCRAGAGGRCSSSAFFRLSSPCGFSVASRSPRYGAPRKTTARAMSNRTHCGFADIFRGPLRRLDDCRHLHECLHHVRLVGIEFVDPRVPFAAVPHKAASA